MTALVAQRWYGGGEDSPATTDNVHPIGKTPVRVTLTDVVADWADVVKARLNHICRLPEGWDGYRGVPTRWDNARFAFELLRAFCKPSTPAPSIVPLPDGGLQIEWHRGGLDIELTVHKPNYVIAWMAKHGREREIELETDFGDIRSWIEDLR